MNSDEVRAADDARTRDRIARWVVAILTILLVLLWWSGYGPGRAGCCAAPSVPPPVAVAEPPAPEPAAPAPQPAPAAAAAPVVECAALLGGADVEFGSASAGLTEAGRASLDKVIGCLGTGNYEVGGHTDSSGDAAANLGLSLARAEAAKAYLVEKGIAAERLETRGYGASKPLASNTDEAGRARNRRIAFAAR
jgi:OmpA-OmpF porin, OOP family